MTQNDYGCLGVLGDLVLSVARGGFAGISRSCKSDGDAPDAWDGDKLQWVADLFVRSSEKSTSEVDSA